MADLYLLPAPPASEVAALARGLSLSTPASTVLWQRGLRSVEAASAWLQPRVDTLGDPYLFRDMDKAVQRIRAAIRGRQRILIHGDYDVDGLAGTVLLLALLRLLGAEVDYHIPARDDGYSFSEASVQRIQGGDFKVCISVDNGTAAIAEVARIQALGCDVIVTDHHHAGPDVAPAFAMLNPRLLDSGYPFPHLAGCAVAFKLGWGLAQSFSPQRVVADELRELLTDAASLVALGSIADVVPLLGENRVLTRVGLKALLQSQNPGIRALIDVLGVRHDSLRADDVSFRIGPRLNAAGRMGHASLAVRLLTATSYGEARTLARELELLNKTRQKIEAEIVGAAQQQVEAALARRDRRVLVVAASDWHLGVVGIVAARLVDLYHRPAIVLSIQNGRARGSGRSTPDVDLKGLLGQASAPLLRYGGHSAAVGIELPSERIREFDELLATAEQTLPPAAAFDRVAAEARASFAEWTTHELRRLVDFRPFGPGNRPPVFLAEGVRVGNGLRRTGIGDRGLTFTAIHDGVAVRAVAPALGSRIEELLARRAPWSVAYTPQAGEREGGLEVQVLAMEPGPVRTTAG